MFENQRDCFKLSKFDVADASIIDDWAGAGLTSQCVASFSARQNYFRRCATPRTRPGVRCPSAADRTYFLSAYRPR